MKRSWLLGALGALAIVAGCAPDPAPPLPTPDVPATDTSQDATGDTVSADTAPDAQPGDAPTQDTTAADVPTSDTAASDTASDTATVDAPPDDAPAGDAATDTASGDSAAPEDAADGATDAPPCPADQTLCGTTCVDLATDPSHCGACGTACSPAGASGACVRGACTIASCNAGRADCNAMAADGCEVDLNASASNCGRCGNACAFANATATCALGVCGVGACNAGFGDCDADAANGCETDLNTSARSCGACGTACTLANATAGCAAGRCAVAVCNAGFGDCDSNAANGCEAALNTNTHCGACGNACSLGTRCSGGTCVSSCPTGTTFCSASLICVNTSNDLNNCGACDNVCPTRANASATCSGGACGFTCSSGYGDCDADATNGCETNLQTAVAACGACGRACALPHATASCSSGACAIARCDAGYGDCDSNAANGCETDLNATVTACGSCGSACSVPNATAGCAAGRCTVSACNAGFGDCDSNAANGCETALSSNTNCGACGTVCAAGTRCAGGACVSSCPEGTVYCLGAGICADLQSDANHCGMCGTACPPLANASPSCTRGTCGFTCNAGFADCDGNAANGCEANLSTSVAACGACGRACTPPHATGACATGVCTVVACAPGYGDCNGDPTDGCEVDLTSTASACGVCTTACRPANGTGSCAMGRCGVASCDAGYGDCDSNAANGCETALTSGTNCGACGRACAAGSLCSGGTCVSSCMTPTSYCGSSNTCVDTTSDPGNCGGCGRSCPIPPNALASCASSVCGLSCTGAFADCDRSATNGCEIDLNSSPANCGACGNACVLPNATAACRGNACAVASCTTGYANCDGNATNGCETNLGSSATHCGTCGNACSFANAAATCAGGTCALGACNAGYGNCNGRASDGCELALNTNTNCGACGTRCAAGTYCSGGACVSVCPTGTTYCAAQGACLNLQTNPNACGSCGTVCPTLPHVVRTCSAGVCGGTCDTNWGNCDGNVGNGCETNLNTSVANCGACARACTFPNATAACSSGTCALGACYPGFANCDGTASTGCETNLLNDNNNCGACGRVCRLGSSCRTGSCR